MPVRHGVSLDLQPSGIALIDDFLGKRAFLTVEDNQCPVAISLKVRCTECYKRTYRG